MKKYLLFLPPLLGVLVYLNAIGGSFILDDNFLILNNPLIKNFSSVFKFFSLSYWSGSMAENSFVYRPVVNASFVLNWLVSEGAPWSYKVFNIAFHVVNVFLICRLLSKLTGNINLSVLLSILFAIHPINSEAVNGISYRTDLMVLFFFLLSIELFVLRKWFISALVYGFALFSKENAVALVLVFPVLCMTVHPDLARRFLVSIFSVLGIYFVFRFKALGSIFKGASAIPFLDNPIGESPFIERFVVALRVVCMNFEKFIFPWDLSADYSYNTIDISSGVLEAKSLAGLSILVLLLSFFIYSIFKRNKLSCMGFLIFFPSFVLTSNLFFPITNIMAERFFYVPHAGLLFVIASCLKQWMDSFGDLGGSQKQVNKLGWRKKLKKLAGSEKPREGQRLIYVFLISLSIVFSARTFFRNLDWKNEGSLFSSASEVSAGSARVWFMVGNVEYKAGNFKRARAHYEKAIEIYPDYVLAHSNLCVALAKDSKYFDALNACTEALKINPAFEKARSTMKTIKSMIGL